MCLLKVRDGNGAVAPRERRFVAAPPEANLAAVAQLELKAPAARGANDRHALRAIRPL